MKCFCFAFIDYSYPIVSLEKHCTNTLGISPAIPRPYPCLVTWVKTVRNSREKNNVRKRKYNCVEATQDTKYAPALALKQSAFSVLPARHLYTDTPL